MNATTEDLAIASRKEIFDYLRNVQKETEIKARLSGINIWVLYGALSFVCWTLLEPSAPGLSRLVWNWALYICQILVCFSLLLMNSNVRTNDDDFRFQPGRLASMSPLSHQWCMKFLWIAAPFIAFGILRGFSLSSILIPLLMFGFIILELFIRTDSDDLTIMFNRTRKIRFLVILVDMILLGSTLWDGADLWSNSLNVLNRAEIKVAASLVAIYYLISLLIERGLADKSDAWTYELEKKLLLGLCSPTEALTTIENHSLGARLMTVVERKRLDLTASADEVKKLLQGAIPKVEEIAQISSDYVFERTAQFTALSTPIRQAITHNEASLSKFDAFKSKLAAKNKKIKNLQIDKLIDDLTKEISHFQIQLTGSKRLLTQYEETILRK
jgi:hypothetical protein